MKAGNEHRVPLSDSAMEVLKVLEPLRQGEFVFHGRDATKPLSAGALEMLMRRLKVKSATTGGPTVHGFRSAFRDWAGDCTSFRARLRRQRSRIASATRWKGPIAARMRSSAADP